MCACGEIKKSLVCSEKNALNNVINPFWYTNILFDSYLFVNICCILLSSKHLLGFVIKFIKLTINISCRIMENKYNKI